MDLRLRSSAGLEDLRRIETRPEKPKLVTAAFSREHVKKQLPDEFFMRPPLLKLSKFLFKSRSVADLQTANRPIDRGLVGFPRKALRLYSGQLVNSDAWGWWSGRAGHWQNSGNGGLYAKTVAVLSAQVG